MGMRLYIDHRVRLLGEHCDIKHANKLVKRQHTDPFPKNLYKKKQ